MTTAKAPSPTTPATKTPTAAVKATRAVKTVVAKTLVATPVNMTASRPVATKVPSKAVVGKVAVKRPLSKVFAPAKIEKVAKVDKAKKAKLVRDSFTIPKAEFLVLEELKQRATQLTRPAKKSELLRAGIKALAALSDAAFLTALEQVPAIKTGRPAASK